MKLRIFWPLVLLVFYLLLFIQQERHFAAAPAGLSHPLPPRLQEIALGYLRQLGGGVLFVKASVFLGGIDPAADPEPYAAPLAGHAVAAAHLHPRLLDIYYFTQASLPHISPDYARQANEILRRGMTSLPDQFVLPFFIGFNHFYHLRDYTGASTYLREASQRPGAPSWLGHLAGTLAAQGGDIYGGLFWLRAMLAGEEEEGMRERYRHSISMFERAVVVQQALERYQDRHGQFPADLAALVPDELAELPEFDPPFRLSWEPPQLRLLRQSK